MKAILHILHKLVFKKCPVILYKHGCQGLRGGSYIIKSSVPCLIILLDSNTLKQSFHIVSHQEGARFELESVREREL